MSVGLKLGIFLGIAILVIGFQYCLDALVGVIISHVDRPDMLLDPTCSSTNLDIAVGDSPCRRLRTRCNTRGAILWAPPLTSFFALSAQSLTTSFRVVWYDRNGSWFVVWDHLGWVATSRGFLYLLYALSDMIVSGPRHEAIRRFACSDNSPVDRAPLICYCRCFNWQPSVS